MEVHIGTKLKLNLHIEKFEDLSLSDYDFSVEIYTPRGNNKIIYSKDNLIKIDDDNYVFLVDTSIIGLGRIYVKIIAKIPDYDFEEKVREEIQVINSGIVVID